MTRYQAVLFEDGPDPIGHWFYLAAHLGRCQIKSGQTDDLNRRMRELGTSLIVGKPCGCTLRGKYRKCVHELAWESAHRTDIVPGHPEWWYPFGDSDVFRSCEYRLGLDNEKGLAVLRYLLTHQKAA